MNIVKYPEKGRFSPDGVIVKWNKKEGKQVKKGDLLLSIESAGELLEVEAATDGILLKAIFSVGSSVFKGQPLAVIGNKGEDISGILKKLDNSQSAPTTKPFAAQAKPKPVAVAAQPSQAVQNPTPQTQTSEVAMTAQPTSDNPNNVIPILMPQAGQSMEEGTILSWKVKEGDTIAVGQIIMEIETDKATMEVEAVNAGRITKIVAAEGDIVEVKQPVAFLAGEGVAAPAAAPALEPASATAAPTAQSNPAPQTPAPPAPSQPVSATAGAEIPILMPQAGQSMEEGTILSWKVKEGDSIAVGQIIMEIETDKATMEVEAVDAGRITRIVSAEGDIVEVKQPVAFLAGEGVAAPAAAPAPEPAPAPTAPPAPAVSKAPVPSPAPKTAPKVSRTGRAKASPAARKAAQQKGIDLSSVASASGPGGRILSTDIDQADVIPTEIQIRPLTKMRRAIANNLLHSKQNVPHFYAKKTIDAALLFATYRTTKEVFKCSVNDFVTKACAKAIRLYPAFRSQYKDTEVHENPAVNIGIAVGTDEGLTVPVVLNADRQNLEQLAAQTRQVVESARNGKLENFGHGIFTITNLGMFGCEEFSAIINPPESAILAVGAIREGAVVENGAIRPTRLMTLTLSVDHRVVDGVLAAQFLNTVQELLEDPEQLIG